MILVVSTRVISVLDKCDIRSKQNGDVCLCFAYLSSIAQYKYNVLQFMQVFLWNKCDNNILY